MDVTISKLNEVYLKVYASEDIMQRIHDAFKYYCDGYKNMPSYKYHYSKRPRRGANGTMVWNPAWGAGWDGTASMMSAKTGVLPFGLLNQLINYLDQCGLSYELQCDEATIPILDMTDEYKKIFKNSEYYPRDYQDKAIKLMLQYKRGVIEYATGSGKSLIQYVLIRQLLDRNQKICLIVPTITLVEQMKADFIDYGWEDHADYLTIMYSEAKPDTTKPVLVTTFQSLVLQDDSFISAYTAVIVDETHKSVCESIKTCLSKMIYAEYRYGVTGTLPDEYIIEPQCKKGWDVRGTAEKHRLGDLFIIYGYIGRKLCSKPTAELIEEGVLSDLNIVNVILSYSDEMRKTNYNRVYVEEVRTVNEYCDRQKAIKMILEVSKGKNTLILVKELKHLDRIYKYIESEFPNLKLYRIEGKVKGKVRLEYIKEVEDQENAVIVATYGTLSTGINIKRLHNIIAASSYKDKKVIIQSLGRGLRVHEHKDGLTYFNLADDLRYKTSKGTIKNNHLWNHFIDQIALFKASNFKYVNKVIKI